MATIPAAVIRRVNRVRDRIDPIAEEPELVLDDIFVLCRAFEGTWSGEGGERQQAEDATVETIRVHGITELPALKQFVEQLRVFVTAAADEFAEWFGSDDRLATDSKREILSIIRALQSAVDSDKWSEHDSRKLGKLFYRMRCAVVHPRLDTHNNLALTVLPSLRAALIELTIARAAVRYDVALAETRQQFDVAS